MHTFIGIPVTVVDFKLKCFCAIVLSLLTNWVALYEKTVVENDEEV